MTSAPATASPGQLLAATGLVNLAAGGDNATAAHLSFEGFGSSSPSSSSDGTSDTPPNTPPPSPRADSSEPAPAPAAASSTPSAPPAGEAAHSAYKFVKTGAKIGGGGLGTWGLFQALTMLLSMVRAPRPPAARDGPRVR